MVYPTKHSSTIASNHIVCRVVPKLDMVSLKERHRRIGSASRHEHACKPADLQHRWFRLRSKSDVSSSKAGFVQGSFIWRQLILYEITVCVHGSD